MLSGTGGRCELDPPRNSWRRRQRRTASALAAMLPAAPTRVEAASRPIMPSPPTSTPRRSAAIVYLSPAPGAPALAPVGAFVEVGATVCVIEAMKVFNEVRAERAGMVEAVLVQSGDEVDAGQPLFRIG